MELVINNEAALRVVSEPVSLNEGREIARKMAAWVERNNKKAKKPYSLAESKSDSQGKVWKNPNRPLTAIGLAAPQLGIYKRVALATIKGRLIPLINPTIVSCSKHLIPWEEQCMSFPARKIDTFRHAWVEVKCDNWTGIERIGPETSDWTRTELQDAVCVQHEIAHLFGLLMFDFTTPDGPSPIRWGQST